MSNNITFGEKHSLQYRDLEGEKEPKKNKSTEKKTSVKLKPMSTITKSLVKDLDELKKHYTNSPSKELGDYIVLAESSLNKFLDTQQN
ncbi:MAG: hypothetical protein ACOC22_03135 [bacterium]